MSGGGGRLVEREFRLFLFLMGQYLHHHLQLHQQAQNHLENILRHHLRK